LLAFQLGHVSMPPPAAPATVVVLPPPPVVIEKPAPQLGAWEPCWCNNPCGECGQDAPRHLYFRPAH
jgi:hypothetical protein